MDREHYATIAGRYARFRPHYPAALFAYLVRLPRQRIRALDCGTGNGQAASGLAPYFQLVAACDPVLTQVRHANRIDNVRYLVAGAESQIFRAGTIDLVVAAQAAHWFHLESFYRVIEQVSTSGAAVALWCYGLLTVSPDVDRVIHHFYYDVVGPYWSERRRLVDDGYSTMPFPFRELEPPEFRMEETWQFSELIGYLETWSAVRNFRDRRASDPLEEILPDLRTAWGEPGLHRRIHWPLHLRVGTTA